MPKAANTATEVFIGAIISSGFEYAGWHEPTLRPSLPHQSGH